MKNLISRFALALILLSATISAFGQYVPTPNPLNNNPATAVPTVGTVTAVNTTSSYAVNVAPGPLFCQGGTAIVAPTQIQLSNPYTLSSVIQSSPTATWYIAYNCGQDQITATINPSPQQIGNYLLATVVVGCNTCLTATNDIQSITATTAVGMFLNQENVLTFSATPTFSILSPINTITLTANVTSSTLAAGYQGQLETLNICQNGTGSFTFAFPATVRGATTIGSTANKCNTQTFYYSTAQTAWIATGTGVTNQ